jgi:hypothetical protein
MTEVIDSLIESCNGYHRAPWDDIPDQQKRVKQAGRSGQTLSGYGDKIPTDRMVHYRGRWQRIYCRIYSNVGTLYFVSGGKRIIVA